MHGVEESSTTQGLPVSPSLGPALRRAGTPVYAAPIDWRAVYLCGVSMFIGLAAGAAAWMLLKLIAFFIHLAFYGQISFALDFDTRATRLGPFIVFIPVIGGVIVGLLARYGSRAVAGHGIPEAMEQVLTNESRIPARMTFLKPFSAAVSIGTGGPFGPEGPIIATGGAIGSLVGQIIKTTAAERKILLSAGAAAGIAAAFGTPVAAVLLAIELLLFEFRPRSILCVALASAVAALVHAHFDGPGAMFPFKGAPVPAPSDGALLIYSGMGVLIGAAAVVMTRAVYLIEQIFERLPIHWMWCPALGAVAVGVIGFFDPGILGPGYFNIRDLLGEHFALKAAIILCILKFVAWTVSLGSGTSGGTLAPVFTIGGALAMAMAILTHEWFPNCGIDLRVAALMGMVAIFAGASRALLTCIIFAVEVTHAPNCILPAICGCSVAYLTSALLMRNSIMTEKLARQGIHVPVEYGANFGGTDFGVGLRE
ncbi:MAG TPA: chloride channel protein [Tepidisphaeraceae bacterium]|nr:chloride channel protein [Tepidisphaeraceae bacterium]